MKKVSLLIKDTSFDIFNLKKDIEMDERVLFERNKIMNNGFNVLLSILFIIIPITNLFKIYIDSEYILGIVALVCYIMLLYFCSKDLIKDNNCIAFLLIASIQLPISLANIAMNGIAQGEPINLIVPNIIIILTIIVIILMYILANNLYKGAVTKED